MAAALQTGGDIPVPAPVLAILRRLEDAGHETWCVGGAVRDELLGNVQQDVDLATAAAPEVVLKLFRRTVPVGIEHGTIGVLDDDNVLHEVTTFRRDVRTDGRHAIVEFGVSLDEDLARRDFTINAIAYHPVRHAWRDPFAGRDDLRQGIIRAVGEPAVRFAEDRLRILRAHDIGHLSAERVRGEWVKSIATARSLDTLVQLWFDSGVTRTWLPECRAPNSSRDDVPVADRIATRDPVVVTAAFCSPNATIWRRFKGSNDEIHRAEAIDRAPPRPASAAPRDVRRWIAMVGAAADDLRTLARWRGDDSDGWSAVLDQIRLRGEATGRSGLAVTGDDLIGAGIAAGPEIGRTLDRLLGVVLDEPALNTREALLALARKAG